MTTTTREVLAELYPEILLLEERYDSAILGVAERCGFGPVACYDCDILLMLFAAELAPAAPEDERLQIAQEHFEFNVLGAYVGEEGPVFLRKVDLE